MIPRKVVVGGIVHRVVFEDTRKLRGALKQLGVKNWEKKWTYWDLPDRKIYISDELPRQLQKFLLCLEIMKAMSFFVGDKLWENERILRPYAMLLYQFLEGYEEEMKRGKYESEEKTRYIS
ncbi:MAG: hypothetical protein H5T41_09860 [Methanomassiliicoccales archaeon]|nr:hypothetical protein [Methanomassiliicoccales archaeon]